MRFPCLTALAVALLACLSGCSSTGISATASYNPGYGPFDQNGNYVEAWADKPAKKHWWSRQPAAEPTVGPSTPAGSRKEPPVIASLTPRSSTPAPSVTRTPPQPRPTARQPVASRPETVSRPPEPRPVSRPPVIAANTSPKPAASPPPPKPKPKPTPKPAPKPAPSVRHTVAKGDTLYSLSRRYGTSVSAIQSANGISGTNIRIGQSLKIPK